jgi:hypothetical protein
VWKRSEPKSNLRPLLTEASARTTGSSPYVYLSDGGHFENLGLYEMVRRRCRSIVVVDATCDWKYAFHDLEGAIRKIRIDLGITIEFRDGLPTQERASKTLCHYAMGVIRYADVDGEAATEGRICYIKPVLTGEEDVDVARYAAQHAGKTSPFPHQSTGDQFFTEAQFESYRVLGRFSVEKAFGPGGEWPQNVRWLPEGPAGAGTPPPSGTPVPPGMAGGAASGATHMLSSMGQGALVASALTVGGVLGVTGTVALKDATVRIEPGAVIALDDQDRRLLQTLSIPGGVLALDAKDRTLLRDLSIKSGALALNPEDRKLLQGLSVRGATEELQQVNLSVRAVAEAVVKLGEAVKGIAPADKLDAALAALAAQVRNLAVAVGNLKLQPGGGSDRIEIYSTGGPGGAVRVDLVDLNKTLVAIHESLRVQGAGTEQTRNAALMLAEIIKQLDKLNTTVAHTLPNRNVRGVGEGGGR